MANGNFVAYYRVSTDRQGRSGLGLDGQKKAVADWLNGGRHKVVASHIEVESGKREGNRPELLKALAACRIHKATLVVASTDRLSRNTAFLLTLKDAGVEFVAVDFPDANRMTISVLAIFAEHEALQCSIRTKKALAAAKARGVKVGTPANLTNAARGLGRIASAKVRQARAAQRAADLAPDIAELRKGGASSFSALARGLNDRGTPTARGHVGKWSAAQVRRVVLAK